MARLETNKEKLLDYDKKESARLEHIRQNAQFAYKKAQDIKKQGDTEAALQWMNRAYRLAKDNPNITFDLVMLYLTRKDYDRAYALLSPLMRKFSFYEGWIALAILFSVKKSFNQLSEILHRVLSRFCPTSDTWGLLTNLLRQTGNQIGCCGVVGSLNQLWIENFTGFPVHVYFDDQLSLVTNQKVITMPQEWQEFKKIRVESKDVPLVGSIIDLQQINHTEGFVEVEKGKITGWIWYPAEPDRIPDLIIEDQDGNSRRVIKVRDEMEVVSLDTPLFRAKRFSFSVADLPLKKLYFKDGSFRNLIGSPIDLVLEQKRQFFAGKGKSLDKGGKNTDYQDKVDFFPVKASFKGKNPEISLHASLGVVIVIPVYKGKDVTLACINSVLRNTPETVMIQLVNDCSPDTELIEQLTAFVDGKRVFCIHHQENMGYPVAVNHGMAAWPGYDVVLLNSDTLVSEEWLKRLSRAAYGGKTVGTVTAFSNDVSIYSYPSNEKKNPLLSEKEVHDLAMFFRTVHAGKTTEIPTSHGFCMFIRHDCLKQTGLFREDLFAQGYGEENDFSMRARHLGWKHLLATDVFIGHQGSVSFQDDKENLVNSKNFLIKRNMRILSDLYPGYGDFIKGYMRRNPLLPFRREIDMERIRAIHRQRDNEGKSNRYVLLVTHQYGGGVERAVRERADSIRLKAMIPVIVKPTPLEDGCRLEIQFRSPMDSYDEMEWFLPNLVFHFLEDGKKLERFLQELTIDCIEIHHLHEHHEFMRDLIYRLKKPCDVYIHDYLFFCPRTVLLNGSGQYCGDLNNVKECQNCINTGLKKDVCFAKVSVQNWIKDSEIKLKQARCVFVPSDDGMQRVTKHFPDLRHVRVFNLEDDRADLSLSQLAYFSRNHALRTVRGVRHTKRYRIGLIGAIGVSKGFRVVQALLRDADKRDLPLEFIVVGRSFNDQLLMKSNRMFITGEYKEEEAVALVLDQGLDIAFFPSIWPETWCYSLSIAWRAGLRTVAYDMGAIAERIKKTDRGILMPLNLPIAKQNDFLLKECKHIRS